MCEISADVLTSEDVYCVFVRYADTRNSYIKKINVPARLEGQMKKNVTHIIFYRAMLPKFPRELGEFFPNLRYIDIFGCFMTKVCKEDLKHIPNLEKLKLESNNITHLPGDLFDYTPNIIVISFFNNCIQTIGPQIFDNCNKLIEVDLSGNSNINYRYSNETNTSLEELKKIIRRDCKPVKDLQEIAIETLIESLTLDTAEDTLFIASQMGFEKLKDKAEEVLKNH